MGVYVTRAQLVDRYGDQRLVDLTDRATPRTFQIDDAVLDRAIADAGALIDAHLAGRYALPLGEVPQVLIGIASVLVYASLHVDGAPDRLAADRTTALRQLVQFSDGTLKLPLAAAEEPAPASNTIEIVAPDRLFGRSGLAGY